MRTNIRVHNLFRPLIGTLQKLYVPGHGSDRHMSERGF
jgi:hypothetical protein